MMIKKMSKSNNKNNKPYSSVNENFHPGTKVLNKILDKCKTHGNKRLGHPSFSYLKRLFPPLFQNKDLNLF